MTFQAVFVIGVLVGAFILFIAGRMRPDVIAALVLVILVLSGIVPPSEVFSGFSSFAVITIAGLMVIGSGLEQTGVVKWVAMRLEGLINRRYNRLLLLNTGIPGLLSGFINIVAAASFFIPVILRLCKQMKVAQSKILLPMACTALIGANLSLIGASHNLIVNSLLKEATGEGFAFFEFTLLGAAILAAGLIYIFFLGQHLLPGKKETPAPEDVTRTPNLIETYGLQDRLFEVWVSEDIQEEDINLDTFDLQSFGLVPIAIVRRSEHLIIPGAVQSIEQGDMVLLQGQEQSVKAFAEEHPLLTFVGHPKSQEKYPISTGELAEAVIHPRSPIIGQAVGDLEILKKSGMTPIAYYRDNQPHRTDPLRVKVREGDGLLVYGPREKMRDFNPEKELLIYYKPGDPSVSQKKKKLAPIAALILLLVIAPAAAGILPIAVTAVAGALLMVLFGIVSPQGVYEAIDGRTLVLVGAMYPLGLALNTTGAADFIGGALIAALGGFGSVAVLAGLVLLCMILTQPIHNAAVAIIMTPIAINAAELLGVSPRGFCVAVVVACSTAFLMPYGHPAPYLVQEPGGYTAGNYFKFGIGLNLIAFAVILLLVPLLWPF